MSSESCANTPETTGPHTRNEQFRTLSNDDLDKLYQVAVLDKDNKKIKFDQLVEAKDERGGDESRVVIIVIRHFFCGSCQQYVQALAKESTPDTLSQLSPPTKLKIIGCGDPGLIPYYLERTNCPFELFTDPSRTIYEVLGCGMNMRPGEQKPGYLTKSTLSSTVSSIWSGLTTGSKALSGGNFSQNGGEFVFEGGRMVYARRMMNSSDHLEVKDLLSMLREGKQSNGDERKVDGS